MRILVLVVTEARVVTCGCMSCECSVIPVCLNSGRCRRSWPASKATWRPRRRQHTTPLPPPPRATRRTRWLPWRASSHLFRLAVLDLVFSLQFIFPLFFPTECWHTKTVLVSSVLHCMYVCMYVCLRVCCHRTREQNATRCRKSCLGSSGRWKRAKVLS